MGCERSCQLLFLGSSGAIPAPQAHNRSAQADAMKDVAAAIALLRGEGRKVGVVGYCWGGLLTWRSACLLQGLSAAAPYYGGGMTTEAESARQAKVPVMAHFAEEDKWISMESVAAFQKAQPAAQVFTYPAHHGFNCNHRGTWQADAAALAKQRSLAFFKMHLLGSAH